MIVTGPCAGRDLLHEHELVAAADRDRARGYLHRERRRARCTGGARAAHAQRDAEVLRERLHAREAGRGLHHVALVVEHLEQRGAGLGEAAQVGDPLLGLEAALVVADGGEPLGAHLVLERVAHALHEQPRRASEGDRERDGGDERDAHAHRPEEPAHGTATCSSTIR